MPTYILDTSLLLGGREPPRDGPWLTTPEADAEVSPGGRDARRFAFWKEVGLQVRAASAGSTERAAGAARGAGSLARMSAADLSLAALALDAGPDAVLVTDDYTLLDVAKRLGITTRTVNTKGIDATADWRPRCTGCGRWFDEAPPGDECPICGSPVKLRRDRR